MMRRRRRRPTRPDESMQDHRQPGDTLAWTIYVVALVALVASAFFMSQKLDLGWGEWAVSLFGAVIIGTLISLAVLPSLRRR